MNVLDVMDHAIRCVHQGASPEHAAWHAQLTEARAAVAELIEATSRHIHAMDHPVMDGKDADRRGKTLRALSAALARVGGSHE